MQGELTNDMLYNEFTGYRCPVTRSVNNLKLTLGCRNTLFVSLKLPLRIICTDAIPYIMYSSPIGQSVPLV